MPNGGRRHKRSMSVAHRKALSESMKKHFAVKKKAKKKAAKKAAKKR